MYTFQVERANGSIITVKGDRVTVSDNGTLAIMAHHDDADDTIEMMLAHGFWISVVER